MRRMWKLVSRFLAVPMLLASAPLLTAQTAVQQPQKLIDDRMTTILGWEHEAHIQIALAIVIIVFGASVGVLQAYNRSWCKVMTVVLGAGISVMTGINSKVFEADYRALQRAALEGRAIVRSLNEILSR